MAAAVLNLVDSISDRWPSHSLRRWLNGNWVLLFSHADDFAEHGFEADRWLVHVSEAFAATRVRPIAIDPTATLRG